MATTPNKKQLPGEAFDVAGHQIHLVHAPEDRLQAVMQLIAVAKKSVRMFSYMFANDQTGQEVLAALTLAATRGVKVQLIIDSFGSAETPHDFFDPLVKAGGCYHCFSSRWGLGYFVRNHQKILLIDDMTVLVGGYNITDFYFGRKGDKSWEDLGLIVAGPEVAPLTDYFDDLSGLSGDGGVPFTQMRRLIRSWRPADGPIQWLLGGPTNRISPWGLALKRALECAKRLDIVSAYFSPSQTVLRRIGKVTKRNKGSRLVMAGKTDNGATISAARLLYRFLLNRRAKIYEFQPRPLHMKLLVIDDAVYIGSANLDVRSLFINLEIMVRVKDAAFAAAARTLIDGMVEQSYPQTPALLARRDTYWTRFKSMLAYFLVNSVDYSIGRRVKLGLLRNTSKR
ncbi:MAG: phosphatidylserine/phosphatidylglycerophosphate/cardiolipin synthase family protein [Sphingorhabdus sp.]